MSRQVSRQVSKQVSRQPSIGSRHRIALSCAPPGMLPSAPDGSAVAELQWLVAGPHQLRPGHRVAAPAGGTVQAVQIVGSILQMGKSTLWIVKSILKIVKSTLQIHCQGTNLVLGGDGGGGSNYSR